MANEEKKDFNAMLHDSKDMPKFQTITDKTPYWRTLKADGHTIMQKGRKNIRYYVKGYQNALFELNEANG